MKDASFENVTELLELAFDTTLFEANTDGVLPIPYHWVRGDSPLVVVVGENAAGKSFFRRIIQSVSSWDDAQKTECIHLSMEGRNSYMGGMNSLVYGDEEHYATGVNSIRTVTTGITTCRMREKRHVIVWDEPDLGLSDNAAAGVGITLAEFARNPGAHQSRVRDLAQSCFD